MLSDNIRKIREANNGSIIRIQLNQSADKNAVNYLLLSIFEENIIKSIKKGKLHEHTRNIQHDLLEQTNRIHACHHCSLLQSAWVFQSLTPSFAISQSTTLWSQTTQHGLLSRENAVFLFLIHTLDT